MKKKMEVVPMCEKPILTVEYFDSFDNTFGTKKTKKLARKRMFKRELEKRKQQP